MVDLISRMKADQAITLRTVEARWDRIIKAIEDAGKNSARARQARRDSLARLRHEFDQCIRDEIAAENVG